MVINRVLRFWRIPLFGFLTGIIFSFSAWAIEAASSLSQLQASISKTVEETQLSEEKMTKQRVRDKTLQQEMKTQQENLAIKRGEIISLINYLRHIKNFSPFLAALTSPNFKDIVHLNVALGYLAPRVPERFENTLSFLKRLAVARQQFEENKRHLMEAETANKKQIDLLKKHFDELSELLSLTDQSLPLRRFDSQTQLEEIMDRLTVQAMDCEKITQFPEGMSDGVLAAPFTIKNDSFHYADLNNRLVQAPQEGDVLLSGTNVETGGVLLIRKHNCLMLVKGMDQILTFVGTKVAQHQPIGVIFGDLKNPKTVTLTMWQCKSRDN